MIKPLHDFVLIVSTRESNKETKSGIILAETHESERPYKGKILAIGDLVQKVKVGDTVYFKRFAPYELESDKKDEMVSVVHEIDILGIE